MDFNLEHGLETIKATIMLTDPSRSSGLTNNKWRGSNKFEDGAIAFYDNDRPDIHSHYNCLLDVTMSNAR